MLFLSAQVSVGTDVFFHLPSKAGPPGVAENGKTLPLGKSKDISWLTIRR